MLVLTRRTKERIVFPSIQATVEIISVKNGTVRLGIEAPPEVKVFREELHAVPPSTRETNGTAPAQTRLEQATHLLRGKLNTVRRGLVSLQRRLQPDQGPDMEMTLDKVADEVDALCRQLNALLGEQTEPLPDCLLASHI